MIRGGLVGGGPGPLAAGYPWRLLRLSDSLDASWQGPGAARVASSSQDADGWIELGLDNPSPAGLDAYRRWVLRDLAGLPVDDPGAAGSRGILRVRLEVDWSGTDGETVAIALVDDDGDLSTSTGWIAVGYRTASGGASCVSQTYGDPENDEPVGGAVSGLEIVMYAPTGQIGAVFASALADPYDGSGVGGTFAASGGAVSGSRRLVLAAECTTTTDNGPHVVRVRPWYVWIPALEVPT